MQVEIFYSMDKVQHKEKHKILHRALDELLADFILHNDIKGSFTEMPIKELMFWSSKQYKEPDHE
jgi:hypothetical protein